MSHLSGLTNNHFWKQYQSHFQQQAAIPDFSALFLSTQSISRCQSCSVFTEYTWLDRHRQWSQCPRRGISSFACLSVICNVEYHCSQPTKQMQQVYLSNHHKTWPISADAKHVNKTCYFHTDFPRRSPTWWTRRWWIRMHTRPMCFYECKSSENLPKI